MWLIVAEEQAFLSRKILIGFLCCSFWLELTQHFLIKTKQFSFAFYWHARHNVIKLFLQKEKWVSYFHEAPGVLWLEAIMVT